MAWILLLLGPDILDRVPGKITGASRLVALHREADLGVTPCHTSALHLVLAGYRRGGVRMTCTNTTDAFEAQRPRLAGLAYRMLGSVAEAEDVVQDAWLRWHGTDRDTVRDAGAFLRRVVARLCLDRLKSARARRETYVGTWLPEPVVDEATVSGPDAGEWAEDLSFALMLALERLSPLERAAFLLHDVFDVEFDEIAALLDRAEPACRQLAARARAHVRDARPRFSVRDDERARLVGAFMDASCAPATSPASHRYWPKTPSFTPTAVAAGRQR